MEENQSHQSLKENHKAFSFEAIENFDNHIERSIVDYNSIVEDIVILSDYFVEDGENYYDIGCSTGKLVKRIGARHPKSNCIGIEVAENFSEDLKTEDNVRFDRHDIRQYSFRDISLITSIFTLQFIPIKDRQQVVDRIYSSMNDGAGFILLEKMFYEDTKVNAMIGSIAYDYKLNSFTEKEILSKERDLRKIMKIYSLEQNIEMLKKAGFRKIEIIWRRHNFTGIIAIK
jgi:tRNA (cmo5U34)-methyltransferase